MSLPTAGRPLVRVRGHVSPLTARLALLYAAQGRDAAPVADSASGSRSEGRTKGPQDSRKSRAVE
ncbi:predicted protein [Streptomyces lividans TK24]|nr:predicted protein [Streptomyces lividans TK24]